MKVQVVLVLFVYASLGLIDAHAASRWTPKSTAEADKLVSVFFAPSQEIDVEFDDYYSGELELDFYGLGFDNGSFYLAGVMVYDWGDEVSDSDGFGAQAGFKKELYSKKQLSVDLDVKGIYFDLSSDQIDAEYNEVTSGILAKYQKEELVFWGGLDVVLHSDLEVDNKEYFESIDGEADSRINFIVGVGYRKNNYVIDAGVGLFGYEGLILSAGFDF